MRNEYYVTGYSRRGIASSASPDTYRGRNPFRVLLSIYLQSSVLVNSLTIKIFVVYLHFINSYYEKFYLLCFHCSAF